MLRLLTLLALAVALAATAGCGGASDATSGEATAATGGDTTLSLVAYSTPQVAYDEIVPAFRHTAAGREVGFEESFGASGDQSRGVEAGQPADVVAFSLAPDMTRLVDAGLVASGWADTPSHGFVTTSVVVFVVRKGNPQSIRGWADLVKRGVKVLTPNPFSSGGAKWNLLAAYGCASHNGRDPQAGLAYLRELIAQHVSVQDKSGRESLQNFLGGNGDVALSYENEAITAQRKGADIDYVIPPQTIRIENPIAVTKTAPPAAQAFVDFALSKAGQERFAAWGYRPVDRAVLATNKDRFPTPPDLSTIEDFGGWPKVDDELFDAQHGAVAKIEEQAGASAGS